MRDPKRGVLSLPGDVGTEEQAADQVAVVKVCPRARAASQAAFSVWNDGRPEALVIRKPVEPYRVVRTRTHKYILWESKKQALFDLRTDPAEEHNLAEDARYARLLAQMRTLLVQRMNETADPALAWLGQSGAPSLRADSL